MRSWALVLLLLVGCNAITGASDLVVGDGESLADGGNPSATDASVDAKTNATDATAKDVATESATDASADVAPDVLPRPDGGAYVFVTSVTTNGAIAAVGGLAAADQLCGFLAQNAKLGGTWVAWLSTANGVNAIDRIGTATGPWYLVNGQLAVTKSQLTGGSITHPINVTETGLGTNGDNRVWTSTNPGGTYMGNGDCSGYTSSSAGLKANAGSTGATGASWTATAAPSCDSLLHLYCFQL